MAREHKRFSGWLGIAALALGLGLAGNATAGPAAVPGEQGSSAATVRAAATRGCHRVRLHIGWRCVSTKASRRHAARVRQAGAEPSPKVTAPAW